MNDFKERIANDAKKPSNEQIEEAKQRYIENEAKRYQELYDNPEYQEYLDTLMAAIMLVQKGKFPKYVTKATSRFKSPDSIRKKIANRLNEEESPYFLDENGNIKFSSRPLLDAFAMKVTSERMPELLYSSDPHINDLIEERETNRSFLRDMQYFRAIINSDDFSERNIFRPKKPEINVKTGEFQHFVVTKMEYYEKCKELLIRLRNLIPASEKRVLDGYNKKLIKVESILTGLKAASMEEANLEANDVTGGNAINFFDLLDDFESRFNDKVELYNSTMQFLSLFRDNDIFERLGVSVDISSLEEKRAKTGYESNFIILTTPIGPIEVQIQTRSQNEYGSTGPAAHGQMEGKSVNLIHIPSLESLKERKKHEKNLIDSLSEEDKQKLKDYIKQIVEIAPKYHSAGIDENDSSRVIVQKFNDYQNYKALISQVQVPKGDPLEEVLYLYFKKLAALSEQKEFQELLVAVDKTVGYTLPDIEEYANSGIVKKLEGEFKSDNHILDKSQDNDEIQI